MREAIHMVMEGYRRMGRIIRQKYLLPFLGIMALLIVATGFNLTDWTLINFKGTTPTRAMSIDGKVIWLLNDEGHPRLVVTASRTRYLACPGGQATRELVYTDGPNVLANASEASPGIQLDATVTVKHPSVSPPYVEFGMIIPVDRIEGLSYLRWRLTAAASQCEDGEARDEQQVGLLAVPPYPGGARPPFIQSTH